MNQYNSAQFIKNENSFLVGVTFYIVCSVIECWINRFLGKEKQLFSNLKLHAVLSTVFSQLTLTWNCYSAMISSWRHLTSLLPKWKTHPNPVMTQHIRDRSRKPSTHQVWDVAVIPTSPLLMIKHKTVLYSHFQMRYNSLFRTTFFPVASQKNQSIDLLHKSIYWFLHDTIPHQKSFANIL